MPWEIAICNRNAVTTESFVTGLWYFQRLTEILDQLICAANSPVNDLQTTLAVACDRVDALDK